MKISSAVGALTDRALNYVEQDLARRSWDWPIVILTIGLVQLASARLAITEWVPSLNITQNVSLIAVVLGIFLGFSTLAGADVIRLGLVYGIFIIPMQLLTAVERSGVVFDDLRILFFRLLYALDLLVANKPIDDTLFFVLLTSAGFWLAGIYTGFWAVRHRRFLNIVLPSGSVILIVQIYDPWLSIRGWGLALHVFAALALLGRLHYLEHRSLWKRRSVFLPSEAEGEISRTVLVTAAVAVTIAWFLPGSLKRMETLARTWRDFNRPIAERLSNAVSALDSPYGTSPGGDFYETALPLGTTAPLSDAPVFFVEIDDTDLDVLRYYWRGRVYTRYDEGRWTNPTFVGRGFDPQDGEIRIVDARGRSEASLTFTLNFTKQDLLYGPAEMIWTSRPGQVVPAAQVDEGSDVLAWFADPGLKAGDRYEVRALIAYPSVQDLRRAGSDYPEWVTDHYLEVPPELEDPLKELAEEVAGPYTTPYDKAQAITTYLRGEIRYETKILETPPDGRDPLLWVLFDLKKGFCVYYASAEVLMLRTLGIPARMAVGFAQGVYDEEQGRYSVARMDSHAWPEVYFPGVGWVEFEPTAGQDRLVRPDEPQENASDEERDPLPPAAPRGELDGGPQGSLQESPRPEQDGSGRARAANRASVLIPLGALALAAAGVLAARRLSLGTRLPVFLLERVTRSGTRPPRWLVDWVTWSGLMPIERAFHAINLGLGWLGQAQPAHVTPAGRAGVLIRLLPGAETAIADLAREYQAALFTTHAADLARARRSAARILLEAARARIFGYKENLKKRYN